jgi:hypothetical protein
VGAAAVGFVDGLFEQLDRALTVAGVVLGQRGVLLGDGAGQRAGAVAEVFDRSAQRGQVVGEQSLGVRGHRGQGADLGVALGELVSGGHGGVCPPPVPGGQGEADQLGRVGRVVGVDQQPIGQPVIDRGEGVQGGQRLPVDGLDGGDGPEDVLGGRVDSVRA